MYGDRNFGINVGAVTSSLLLVSMIPRALKTKAMVPLTLSSGSFITLLILGCEIWSRK